MTSWPKTQPCKHKAAIATILAFLLLAMTAVSASASPLTISAVNSGNITNLSATITWDTDELANSTVNYGTNSTVGLIAYDSVLALNHSINLSGLTPNTLYYYEVSSTNADGNTTVDDNGGTYHTLTTATTITGVQVIDINTGFATIVWTTDAPATTVVNYGNTKDLVLTAINNTLVFSHSMLLNRLAQHTAYYYEVQSTNSAGSTAIENNGGIYFTFNTKDFITAITEPLSHLVLNTLATSSFVLNFFVNLDAPEPLTSKGLQLIDMSSRLVTGFAHAMAQILGFLH